MGRILLILPHAYPAFPLSFVLRTSRNHTSDYCLPAIFLLVLLSRYLLLATLMSRPQRGGGEGEAARYAHTKEGHIILVD